MARLRNYRVVELRVWGDQKEDFKKVREVDFSGCVRQNAGNAVIFPLRIGPDREDNQKKKGSILTFSDREIV